ncbi:MAG: hypothetical protein E7099_05615 [Mediterranea massiliensis]|nr:hypothetical protein [Mediterranea massiliensis]
MKNNVLLIAPNFFDYHTIIIENLKKEGYNVDYFEELPSLIYRWVYKQKAYDKWYERIENKISKLYDVVFVIKGDKIPLFFLQYLREKQKKAFFINYLWDDIVRFPGFLERLNFFDRVITYSRLDAIKYNLFFYPIFFSCPKKVDKKIYDITFIGSWHSNRLEYMNEIKRINPHLNIYSYLFCSPRKLLSFRGLWAVLTKKAFLLKLSYNDTMEISASSYAILDLPIKNQFSPTTRVVEAISTKTKILTTCEDIVNYDFYHPDNIMVITESEMSIDEEWLKRPFQELEKEIVDKYSISSWIKNVVLKTNG